MDWANVNLESGYEADQNILDSYNFSTLMLEIACNMRKEDVSETTIYKHAMKVMRQKLDVAEEILLDNISNITKAVKDIDNY